MGRLRVALRLVLLVLAGVVITGCASTRQVRRLSAETDQVQVTDDEAGVGFDDFDEFSEAVVVEVWDPLQGYNRFMFAFNDKLYCWVLRPIAIGYAYVIPERARVCVRSFFKNLLFPVRFVHNLLQLKFKQAGVEVARFCVNTTVGIGGLFDPAAAWLNLEEGEEDLGQTLAVYGVGEGFPIVLPVLGASNLRDALCMFPDLFLDPVSYASPTIWAWGVRSFQLVNRTSLRYDRYDEYLAAAVDPYIFVRDAYKQNRDKQIEK